MLIIFNIRASLVEDFQPFVQKDIKGWNRCVVQGVLCGTDGVQHLAYNRAYSTQPIAHCTHLFHPYILMLIIFNIYVSLVEDFHQFAPNYIKGWNRVWCECGGALRIQEQSLKHTTNIPQHIPFPPLYINVDYFQHIALSCWRFSSVYAKRYKGLNRCVVRVWYAGRVVCSTPKNHTTPKKPPLK